MLVIPSKSDFKDTSMRLVVLGMYHGTNTFSSVSADYDAFDIYRGQEITKWYAKSQTTVAGYLACSDESPDAEVVPLFVAITGTNWYHHKRSVLQDHRGTVPTY